MALKKKKKKKSLIPFYRHCNHAASEGVFFRMLCIAVAGAYWLKRAFPTVAEIRPGSRSPPLARRRRISKTERDDREEE